MELVALDIGGTNARFALARIGDDGRVALDEPVTLPTSGFASLKTAWEAFARQVPGPVPRAAAIAIAGPVTGEMVQMTNNSWVIHTGAIEEQLGLDQVNGGSWIGNGSGTGFLASRQRIRLPSWRALRLFRMWL